MTESFANLKERIIRQRPTCEVCWTRRATQLHHCLVHDMKQYHKILTVEENLMPICDVCHTSNAQIANSLTVREQFALRQIGGGYDIVGWYSRLPLKIKEHWILELNRTR